MVENRWRGRGGGRGWAIKKIKRGGRRDGIERRKGGN